MFSNKGVDGVFVMPKDVLRYVNNAKKSELKLILYIFEKGSDFDFDKACAELSETPDSLNAALSFWRGTGIITESEAEVQEDKPEHAEKTVRVSEKAPEKSYTTLEVANARLSDNDFKQLVEFTEAAIGELLNAAKQAELYYLYDNLGMECDVIMGVVAHCASAGKVRMSYIKKTAEGIHNDGVRTYKELESYLKAKDDYQRFENAVKRVIGAGDRALTKSERALVEKWEKDWNVDEELIELAYERTISLISKPSLPYMSKILENWISEGIKTAEAARKYLEEHGQKIKKEADDEKAEKARKAGFDIEFEDIFEKP